LLEASQGILTHFLACTPTFAPGDERRLTDDAARNSFRGREPACTVARYGFVARHSHTTPPDRPGLADRIRADYNDISM
jgi:hypothetical protein